VPRTRPRGCISDLLYVVRYSAQLADPPSRARITRLPVRTYIHTYIYALRERTAEPPPPPSQIHPRGNRPLSTIYSVPISASSGDAPSISACRAEVRTY